ncbi:MAG: peptidoglycan-associated lipoprotein Pal [Paracoccaceae bacterium]|jgi:peptidoglycan-associated lipoprotein|tara:strand:- start:186 stop:686 length:501 start_codon:yes stop_codon:yes gene_type:complete
MKKLRNAILVSTLSILAACSNSGNPFGGNSDDTFFGNNMGDVSNPTSPAYFQQAIGDRVFFAIDQSSLSPEGMDLLNSQATWLMTNGDYEIIVEGHADEQGTRDYNVALGARRANSVKEYLNSLGVAASRIQTVSYGKERPIEICSKESCYSVNRRAVTVLSNLGS